MTSTSSTTSPRLTTVTAGLVVTGLWGLGLALGWTSELQLPVAPPDPGHQPWSELVPIVLTNLAVALGLMSGAVTLGVSTPASSVVVALYAGGVLSAATQVWGATGAVDGLLPFAAFELGGLLCAAVAGLIPTLHGVRSAWTTGDVWPDPRAAARGYLTGLRLSCFWCGSLSRSWRWPPFSK